MLKAVCIALLFVATRAMGQIPTSSPALDPDFVVLQPKETFQGYYANQFVGAGMYTVASLQWDIPEGAVFLMNVDTIGWQGNIREDRPTGPFRQDKFFSLFNRALYRLKAISDPIPLFNKEFPSHPLMAINSGLKFLYFPDTADGEYNDTNRIYFSYKAKKGAFGDDSRQSRISLDIDSLDDFIIVTAPNDIDTTVISLWYDDDLTYKGDTSPLGNKIIPANNEFSIPHKINRYKSKLVVHDVDKNDVPDLLYFTETNFFVIVYGKRESERWGIDTVVEVLDTARTILSFHYFDFLYNDGIPDLLISAIDSNKQETSIYCLSGAHHDFRQGFSLDSAELKIPSPDKLDRRNFAGNGIGILYEWGERLFDLGDVNGSGSHSLATLALYQPDTASLGGPTYCFIYSGGKAADERADALFADNSTIYVHFKTMDTVRTEHGKPLNFLLGDPYFSAGGDGKLYYFEGRADIPHRPDPRWLKVVKHFTQVPPLELDISQSATYVNVIVTADGASAGDLVIRDILGRSVYAERLYYAGDMQRRITINTSRFSEGMYIVSYEQDRRIVVKKVFIFH